jgi:hypothetical protein
MNNQQCRLLVAVMLSMALASCNVLDVPKYSITFEVTGTAVSADLVYQYGSHVASPSAIPLPWSFSFTGSQGDWCDLFAASSAGYVTVTIYKGGIVMKTATNAPGGTYQGYNYAEVYGGL